MLVKLHDELENGSGIKIEKKVDGEVYDRIGAFRYGDRITFRLTAPRTMGVAAIVMRIAPDGKDTRDLTMSLSDISGDLDSYELTLDTFELCGDEKRGLFFYEFLLIRGLDTLFTSTSNNVDAELTDHSETKFTLLVYEKAYSTPDWFKGGTMYHIFVDRFFRGVGEASLRSGASLDEDWDAGVPQYAPRPGMPVKNNIYFGGNLWGVADKLDYLKSLGVTVIYLSPIFDAATNHRYDTANYGEIDSLLGGRAAFDRLIKEAHANGMRVILDGVFNHTGDDSIYFNRRGNYTSVGAYQSKASPYAKWYNFRKFPNDYESWWNIEIMPRLQHGREECRRYFTGKDGIAASWIRAGIDGWRLDVADELSDLFLDEFRESVKAESKGDAVIIGEVWENGVTKIAYGRRREYFMGGQLDSVMNYPFRNATLALLLQRDATTFYNILTELYGSYPTFVCHSLMNLLGTHDTERFITRLGQEPADDNDNAALAEARLSPEGRERALRLMRIASALQYTVFGVPSLYYGDEAGLEGHHDPFCRMPFPWGREEKSLTEHYRRLGELRRRNAALCTGDFRFVYRDEKAVAYVRECEEGRIFVCANMWEEPISLDLRSLTGIPGNKWVSAITGEKVPSTLTVPSESFALLEYVK